jgi:hypothetical protein
VRKEDDVAESESDDLETIPDLDFESHQDAASAEEKQDEPCDHVSEATGATEAVPFNNSHSEEESSDFDVPDLDDDSTWKLPELRDYVGVEEVSEKMIFFIHTTAVLSAAGFLLSPLLAN